VLWRYARCSARAGRLPLPRLQCAGQTEAIDHCPSSRSWKIPAAAHDLTLPRMSLEGASHQGDANKHKPAADWALAGAASDGTRANVAEFSVEAAPRRNYAAVPRSWFFTAYCPRDTCYGLTSMDQEISLVWQSRPTPSCAEPANPHDRHSRCGTGRHPGSSHAIASYLELLDTPQLWSSSPVRIRRSEVFCDSRRHAQLLRRLPVMMVLRST